MVGFQKQLFRLVLAQFKHRKLRSALTVVGVVIGIAAIVSLITMSNALKAGIVGELDRFGSDEILMTAKASASGGPPSGFGLLTTDDVKVLDTIPQLIRIDPLLVQNARITFGQEHITTLTRGTEITEEFKDFVKEDLLEGRYLESGDYKKLNIGYKLAKDTFKKEIFVGSSIKINDEKFQVVGIFEEQGDLATDMFIFTDIGSLRDLFGDQKAITAIKAKVVSGADIDDVVIKVQNKLERSRGKDDIGVVTPEQIKEQIGSLLGVVNIVVYSIALISLIVGALGIMNSLFTSVLQRTKEIGTMKAIGARNSEIVIIFLAESALIGLVGGIIGVLLGLGAGYGVIGILNTFGFIKLTIGLDYVLIAAALGVSLVVGILSGLLPAIHASRLQPIKALHHE
ncbi:MAG: ABC transporter permease [Candidatus Woesearchaeota archaeon]|nr:MAG: ABC transporter permease [Candidatus Woesearchaeota archaeon]